MRKLIKAIKFQRYCRVEQEVACHLVCAWTQQIPYPQGTNPHLNRLSSMNRAVAKVNSKMPFWYFFVSDWFGGAYTLNNAVKKRIAEL